MSYLPYLSAGDKTRLSPRARELATQIEKVIQDFQRSYPDTPPGDVQEALSALSGDSSKAPVSRTLLAMSVAGGVAALVGVLVFMGEAGNGGLALPADALLWAVAGLVLLVGIVFMVRQR